VEKSCIKGEKKGWMKRSLTAVFKRGLVRRREKDRDEDGAAGDIPKEILRRKSARSAI